MSRDYLLNKPIIQRLEFIADYFKTFIISKNMTESQYHKQESRALTNEGTSLIMASNFIQAKNQ